MSEETRKYGVPTPEQLARINSFTKRPFTAEEVYTFDAKMIGDALIPNRFIKLDKTLLEVYVKDANSGNVAFMLNHRWAGFFDNPKGVFNMGRVYDSWLAESADIEGETTAQFGSVYIPKGAVKDGVSTDEVIQSIEDGTLRDVSVGIGWSKSECSVCGNSYYSSKCEHFAGQTYDGKLCYVIAKPPGDEYELSGVFAGAYPSAEVLSEIGKELRMEEVVHTEDLKRVSEGTRIMALYGRNDVHLWVPKDAISKKPMASFSIASTTMQEGGDKVEDDKKDVIQRVAAQVAPDVPEGNLEQDIQNPSELALTIDRKKVIEVLGKEMDADSILSLAREGQVLKAELVDDTLEWGVRALGNGFARDFYAQMLSEPGRTIEAIKSLREQFKAQAKEALKPGRVTEPMDKATKKAPVIPDDAYKA